MKKTIVNAKGIGQKLVSEYEIVFRCMYQNSEIVNEFNNDM